jgi:hypothetical protein
VVYVSPTLNALDSTTAEAHSADSPWTKMKSATLPIELITEILVIALNVARTNSDIREIGYNAAWRMPRSNSLFINTYGRPAPMADVLSFPNDPPGGSSEGQQGEGVEFYILAKALRQ